VAAFNTTGQGVVADVFPPQLRGTAMGLFMIPLVRVSQHLAEGSGHTSSTVATLEWNDV